MNHSFLARTEVLITCADLAAIINQFSNAGVFLSRLHYESDISFSATIHNKDIKRIYQIINRSGAHLEIRRKYGFWGQAKYLKRRLVLLMGFFLILFLSFTLPSRILFIEVIGNTSVSTGRILENAENAGISFGAERRQIRSETVKNKLLSEIPQLDWVGINTNGCVASIHVRERQDAGAEDNSTCVESIVAKRDGIIISSTVMQGTAQCKVGEAVTAGQTLISGYTDCGICIQATKAEGEILAKTNHTMTIAAVKKVQQRTEPIDSRTRYALRIGKKVINFYKGSGISDVTCVKMYKEDYLKLPGDFKLPVAFITECHYYYALETVQTDNFLWLDDYCKTYLRNQMNAGLLLNSSTLLIHQDDHVMFNGTFNCIEMIGQRKSEEIIDNYGNDQRKNR